MLRVISAILLAFVIGCGGGRNRAPVQELQPWVGTWKGTGIRENRPNPLQNWTLIMTIKKDRLNGVMNDERGEMRNQSLDGIRLQDGVLTFHVDFETSRGLHVIYRHHARLKGDKLLSEFNGLEGGRSFQGKWEATRIEVAGTSVISNQ